MDKPIVIRDISGNGHAYFELRVGDFRAAILQREHGLVKLNWEVHGPQQWPEAKLMLIGLLELSIIADQLYHQAEVQRGKPTDTPRLQPADRPRSRSGKRRRHVPDD